jgi:hypothetical protein
MPGHADDDFSQVLLEETNPVSLDVSAALRPGLMRKVVSGQKAVDGVSQIGYVLG